VRSIVPKHSLNILHAERGNCSHKLLHSPKYMRHQPVAQRTFRPNNSVKAGIVRLGLFSNFVLVWFLTNVEQKQNTRNGSFDDPK
jgi:hypothetical protein